MTESAARTGDPPPSSPTGHLSTKSRPDPSSFLGSWTLRAGALAGLLLALGAIVNSAGDLWAKIRNLPIGSAEKEEARLFQSNFGKLPVASQPVSIQRDNLTVDMLIAVYDTGDVLVRYGKQERWLAFKPPQIARLSLLPVARAQVPAASAGSAQQPAQSRSPANGGRLNGAPINIDVRALQARELSSAVNENEKTFVLAEMKRATSSFTPTSETFTRTFTADPGHKFTDAKFEVLSGNKFQVKEVKLSEDGRTATVTFQLTSGPIYDQYRSWLQGAVRANQEPIK